MADIHNGVEGWPGHNALQGNQCGSIWNPSTFVPHNLKHAVYVSAALERTALRTAHKQSHAFTTGLGAHGMCHLEGREYHKNAVNYVWSSNTPKAANYTYEENPNTIENTGLRQSTRWQMPLLLSKKTGYATAPRQPGPQRRPSPAAAPRCSCVHSVLI